MRRPILLPLAVLLAGGACTDLDSPAEQDSVLQVTVSPRALPADGFSSAQVVAEIGRASCRERVVVRVDLGGRRIIRSEEHTSELQSQ